MANERGPGAARIGARLGPNWAAQSLFRGFLRGLRQLRLTRATVAAVPRVGARPRGGALGARAKTSGPSTEHDQRRFVPIKRADEANASKSRAGERQRVLPTIGSAILRSHGLYARARRFSPTSVYLQSREPGSSTRTIPHRRSRTNCDRPGHEHYLLTRLGRQAADQRRSEAIIQRPTNLNA